MSYLDDLDLLARNAKSLQPGKLVRRAFGFDGSGGMKADGIQVMDDGDPILASGFWYSSDAVLARRAELQNKPSFADHPDAKCFVQDDAGHWYKNVITDEVYPRSHFWWMDFDGYQHNGFTLICKGELLGDWRDTLERRPDMHKNQEKIDTSVERVQKNPDYVHFNAHENQLKFDECERRRREWSEQGEKADHGKPIMGAIPPHAELAVARVLTFGAEKYSRGNWVFVDDAENRYMDAALRHLNAHRRGELADDESGESHLAHAACCIMFLLDAQEREGGSNE